jgi:ABC-2 type transport system permease protein
MISIFWQYIKDKKVSLLSYSLAAVFFSWLYVALYPSIQDQAAGFSELFKNYPKQLLTAFDIKDFDLSRLELFLQKEFGLILPLMTIFFLVSLAAGAIAFEIETGTLDNLLAKPVSRFTIYVGRYLAGLLILTIFSAMSTLVIIPLAAAYSLAYDTQAYVMLGYLQMLFGSAVFSMSFFLSAVFSEKSKVYMVAGSLIFVMYVLNVIAKLKDTFEKVRYISLFNYYDITTTMNEHFITRSSIFVFLGVSLICFVAGAIWFQRRDIKA